MDLNPHPPKEKKYSKTESLLIYIGSGLILGFWFFSFISNYIYLKTGRYSVAFCSEPNLISGPGPKASIHFDFYFAGKKYYTNVQGGGDLDADLRYSCKNHQTLRYIVKFALEDPDLYNTYIVYRIPSYVLSAPDSGWAEYPPNVKWAGGVLDTAFLANFADDNMNCPIMDGIKYTVGTWNKKTKRIDYSAYGIDGEIIPRFSLDTLAKNKKEPLRLFVKFATEEPNVFAVLLNTEVPESIKKAPKEGWDKLPVDVDNQIKHR